jgi:hypothetical protein
MHDPPAYVWAIIIARPTAIAATTCIALYGGAKRAGQGRRRAALLAGATAGLLGGWFTASAVIAGHGWYPHAAVVSGPGGRVPGHAAVIDDLAYLAYLAFLAEQLFGGQDADGHEDEEYQILPVMRRYVRAESYRWCEKQIQQKASLSTLAIRLTWLARFARPDELSRMLAVGGWPVRLLLALTRPRYRRLERRAFGDLTDSWRNQ